MFSKVSEFIKKLLQAEALKTTATPTSEQVKTLNEQLGKFKSDMSTLTPISYLDIRVGDLTKKYETSDRGVGYISTGMGGKDPGGISYGSYQLETKKGTMQAYLKSKEAGDYGKQLSNFIINSSQFKAKWKELAAKDPEWFNYSQFLYLANKPNGYVEAYNWAKENGWQVNSTAMQAAIYSTVNQSGGWKHGIFEKAGIGYFDPIATQLNKLYDARAKYFERLDGMDSTVRKNIIRNRTVLERKDALDMALKEAIRKV